jgi:hypothetical protein
LLDISSRLVPTGQCDGPAAFDRVASLAVPATQLVLGETGTTPVGATGVAVEEDDRQYVGVAGLAVVESGVEDGEAGHGGVASLSSRGFRG